MAPSKRAKRSSRLVKNSPSGSARLPQVPMASSTMQTLGVNPDDEDMPITTSLGPGKSNAPLIKKTWKYTQTVTFTSDEPFNLTSMAISDGVFRGRQIVMLEPAPRVEKPFRFLELPAEIRNMVYSHLLGDDTMKVRIRVGYHSRISGEWLDAHDEKVPMKPSTNILSVCRSVFDEAASVFYGSPVFVVSSMTDLRKLLTGFGSCTKYLRHLTISYFSAYNTGAAFRLLGEATGLRSLHISFFTAHMGDRWGRAWREIEHLTSALKPFLLTLQEARNDREAVFSILQLRSPEPLCPLIRIRVSTRPCPECEEGEEDYADFMAHFKRVAFKYLNDRAPEKVDENASGLVDEQEDDEDYSYLVPQPAPERRETGRPKRRATLANSYAED